MLNTNNSAHWTLRRSCFTRNVRIKPHFNTKWGREPLQFLKILHTFEGHHRQLLQQWHQPQCWPSMHLKIVFLMSLMNQRSTRRLWQRPMRMLILPPLHLNLRRSFWLKVLLTNYGDIHILFKHSFRLFWTSVGYFQTFLDFFDLFGPIWTF